MCLVFLGRFQPPWSLIRRPALTHSSLTLLYQHLLPLTVPRRSSSNNHPLLLLQLQNPTTNSFSSTSAKPKSSIAVGSLSFSAIYHLSFVSWEPHTHSRSPSSPFLCPLSTTLPTFWFLRDSGVNTNSIIPPPNNAAQSKYGLHIHRENASVWVRR